MVKLFFLFLIVFLLFFKIFLSIKIIPNPAEDIISIENEDNDPEIEQVKIIDITGRLIFTPTRLSKGIDVSTLEPGTYTLMAVTKLGLKVVKFVKI